MKYLEGVNSNPNNAPELYFEYSVRTFADVSYMFVKIEPFTDLYYPESLEIFTLKKSFLLIKHHITIINSII